MKPELSRKAEYMSLGATAVAERGGLNGYDFVIVDPPRKGMDDEVIEAMLQMNNKLPRATRTPTPTPTTHHAAVVAAAVAVAAGTTKINSPPVERLLYVSCGFKAFKRDAARLMGQERIPESSSSFYVGLGPRSKPRYWKLIHAEGHVLFPGSDHIETFAVFDRVS
jgi:tRNA/tmRNA/rRNA uracil-C5-methylase (TrmA/RlmC/RlmD family)